MKRRDFLIAAPLSVLTLGCGVELAAEDNTVKAATAAEAFSFGLVTDVHYADVPPKGSRHYRDSQAKLRQAVAAFNERKLPMMVELGDFIDAGPNKDDTLKYLAVIRKDFEAFRGQRHFVLGNHCLDRMTKKDFLDNCGTKFDNSFYSFDLGGRHFVVLDGDFKKDGSPYAEGKYNWTDTWIPEAQQKWLADDLKKARGKKTVVFIHQNLDQDKSGVAVKNAPAVRKILEEAGNVLAVMQGHHHAGGYRKINGIHYITFKAMVEGPTLKNNAYAAVTLHADERITIEGFGKQISRSIP